MPQSPSECLSSPLSTQSQRDRLARPPLVNRHPAHHQITSPTSQIRSRRPPYDQSSLTPPLPIGDSVSPDQSRTSPRVFATSSPMEPEGITKGVYETPDMSRITPKANSGRKNRRISAPVKNKGSQTSEQEEEEEEEEDPQPPGHTHKSWESDKWSGPRRRLGRRDSAGGNITTPVKSIENGANNESAGSGFSYRGLMFLVVLLGVAIFFGDPSAPTLSAQLDFLNVGIEKLLDDFPSQRELLLTFKRSINNTLSFGDQPATILVTSDETHRTLLHCFLRKLTRVAAQVMNTLPEIEGITAESFLDQASLQSRLQKSLTKNQVAYLKDVHKISGQTALALHAICDNEHAPVKKAVVILSVTGPGLQASEVDVDRVLKKAWEPEIGVDKYSPIFSRISGFFVHFKPDSRSQYCEQ